MAGSETSVVKRALLVLIALGLLINCVRGPICALDDILPASQLSEVSWVNVSNQGAGDHCLFCYGCAHCGSCCTVVAAPIDGLKPVVAESSTATVPHLVDHTRAQSIPADLLRPPIAA
jgi:hypothetical protein